MRAGGRAKKWLWRWRANPLRRKDDVLEAWLVLAVWALISVGGTLAGVFTARAAYDVFAQQRAERTPYRPCSSRTPHARRRRATGPS